MTDRPFVAKFAVLAVPAAALMVLAANSSADAQTAPAPIRLRPIILASPTPSPSPEASPEPSASPTPSPTPAPAVFRAPLLRRPAPAATSTPAPAPAPAPAATARPLPVRVVAIRNPPASIEIKPPADVRSTAPAHAVVLGSGTNREAIKGYPVRRVLSGTAVRSNPRVQLQGTTIDLTPVLRDSNALPNIATRLRSQPALVEVRGETMEVIEIEPGLVVRNFLSYRIKPGACRDGAQRASLARAGARCLNRTTPASRAAAFANPRDPHYIADPRMRADVLRRANEEAAAAEAGVNADLATLRGQLASPAGRAALEAQFGPDEVARIAALDDEALKDELANSAENEVEQVMFVPASDVAQRRIKPKPVYFKGVLLQPATTINPAVLKALANSGGATAQPTEKALPSRVFLTGFTLGRGYEWRYRIQKTISWCYVGCKKTYFAEAYAGFTYGFGLRFPIKLQTTYRHPGGTNASQAKLTANFAPIDGSSADYASTGLAGSQLFSGKEFVAEVTAYAGAKYKLPVIGSNEARFDLGVDFTKDLPAPFTNGQFTPPAPGTTSAPLIKVFDQIDLIGGRASFGAFGAKVFPALKVELKSDALSLTLTDSRTGEKTKLTQSGQQAALSIDPKDQSSSFTIGDPVYNLGFQLTPGINPRLYINLAVWGDSWDWPVWFPEMGITLPAGGADFACHEDTVCNRNYRVSPTKLADNAGDLSPFEGELSTWGVTFDNKWQQQCADETCKFGVKLVRLNAVLLGKQANDAAKASGAKPITMAGLGSNFAAADAKAQKLVQESQLRLTQKASKGWVILYQAVWSKRCSDVQCIDAVTQLSEQMGQTAVNLQQQQPDESSLQIQGQAGKMFLPKFQAAIDASKARAAAKGF
ncbi:MAG: hypothetical protein RL299_406 [Pseudomonadota bacterium]